MGWLLAQVACYCNVSHLKLNLISHPSARTWHAHVVTSTAVCEVTKELKHLVFACHVLQAAKLTASSQHIWHLIYRAAIVCHRVEGASSWCSMWSINQIVSPIVLQLVMECRSTYTCSSMPSLASLTLSFPLMVQHDPLPSILFVFCQLMNPRTLVSKCWLSPCLMDLLALAPIKPCVFVEIKE